MGIPILEIFRCTRPILFYSELPAFPFSIRGSGFLVRYHGRVFAITARRVAANFDLAHACVQYNPGVYGFVPMFARYVFAGSDPKSARRATGMAANLSNRRRETTANAGVRQRTVCLVLIGNVVSDVLPAAIVIMAVGASCGACVTVPAFSLASCIPRRRATGLGWTAGCGRLGSVFGTMSRSVLLATGMAVPSLLKVASIPCFVAGASFLALLLAARKRPEKLMPVSAKGSA
jgi:hypothetical protein